MIKDYKKYVDKPFFYFLENRNHIRKIRSNESTNLLLEGNFDSPDNSLLLGKIHLRLLAFECTEEIDLGLYKIYILTILSSSDGFKR
jgi:hypothetical protein